MTNFHIITFNTIYDEEATLNYIQKSVNIYTRRVRVKSIQTTTGHIIGTTEKCDCELTLMNNKTKKLIVTKRIQFYEVLTKNYTLYLVPKHELDTIRYSVNNTPDDIKKLYGHTPYREGVIKC